MNDSEILSFLKSNKLLSLATVDENGKPWLCNVFFGVDDDVNIYFTSTIDSNHARHMINNPEIAFTSSDYNKENEEDKVAVQGVGKVKQLSNIKDIAIAGKCIFEKFSDWNIVPKEMIGKLAKERVYKITPTYIKFWSDKLGYKHDNVKEIRF